MVQHPIDPSMRYIFLSQKLGFWRGHIEEIEQLTRVLPSIRTFGIEGHQAIDTEIIGVRIKRDWVGSKRPNPIIAFRQFCSGTQKKKIATNGHFSSFCGKNTESYPVIFTYPNRLQGIVYCWRTS